MQRLAPLLAVLCVALAAAAPAAAGGRAPAAVNVTECQPGTEGATTRAGAFRARMRLVRGARAMQMRFYLLERLGDGRFRRVDAPGLATWRTARKGAKRFVYTQRIDGLKAHAAYRVIVQHRWLGRRGERLRLARRRSDLCEVEGALPNLRVVRISIHDGLYSVAVRNAGAAAAAAVPLSLSVDGVALPPVSVAPLAPFETRWIRVQGPRCAGGASAAVDPDDALRESSESDNTRAIRCRRR